MCDKLVFDLAQEVEGSPNVFIRKDWLNILDNQNQNYNIVMKFIATILLVLSAGVHAQNAPDRIRNPYPNMWCPDFPQHIRHSPVYVPCPSRQPKQPKLYRAHKTHNKRFSV